MAICVPNVTWREKFQLQFEFEFHEDPILFYYDSEFRRRFRLTDDNPRILFGDFFLSLKKKMEIRFRNIVYLTNEWIKSIPTERTFDSVLRTMTRGR